MQSSDHPVDEVVSFVRRKLSAAHQESAQALQIASASDANEAHFQMLTLDDGKVWDLLHRSERRAFRRALAFHSEDIIQDLLRKASRRAALMKELNPAAQSEVQHDQDRQEDDESADRQPPNEQELELSYEEKRKLNIQSNLDKLQELGLVGDHLMMQCRREREEERLAQQSQVRCSPPPWCPVRNVQC